MGNMPNTRLQSAEKTCLLVPTAQRISVACKQFSTCAGATAVAAAVALAFLDACAAG